MSPELSQKLAAAVDGMPAFPKSVQAILDLTRDVNCTPKDLVQVIDKDPVVTVKILKVVNSAYYSLPKQIASVNHAVVFLGFNTIKNLALGIAAIGMLIFAVIALAGAAGAAREKQRRAEATAAVTRRQAEIMIEEKSVDDVADDLDHGRF